VWADRVRAGDLAWGAPLEKFAGVVEAACTHESLGAKGSGKGVRRES
jgi:hypothetical protein